MALKNKSDEVINDYSENLARTQHTKLFFKYIKKPKKRQELIDQVKKKLIIQINSIPNNPEFIYKKPIKLTLNKQNEYVISNFATGSFSAIKRSDQTSLGLPNYYFLLFSNIDLIASTRLSKDNVEFFRDKSFKSINAEVETKLRIKKYQNNQDFQSIITQVSIYSKKPNRELITSFQEKRELNNLNKNWLLSDGYTNKLVGIHSFSIFGTRLQDNMNNVNILKNLCKKTHRINNHQAVICEHPFSENTEIITTYVGGKLAQLFLTATNTVSPSEITRITSELTHSLMQKKVFFTNQDKQWDQHLSEFKFYSSSFNTKTAKHYTDDYKIYNNDDTKISKRPLVFSMVAHETKELIQ